MSRILRNSKGTVLIIVLGVLAVLALLATSFAVVASIDRSVSNSYLDQIRAGRLARSGVAAAVAALSADPTDTNLRYWGNDEDEDGQPDPGESPAGAVSIHDVPLDFAQNPSLAVEMDGDPRAGLPVTKKINVLGTDGKPVTFGISGFHSSSTYAPESDVYQLRIKDMSGRLHLNDGANLFGGNQSSVSQNLRRILNVLGKLPTVGIPGLGDRIMSHRPPGGFGSMLDLKNFLSAEERRRVEPFVTVHAWVDRNVANPVPLSSAVSSEYPVQYERSDPPVYRRGRGRSYTGGKIVSQLRWFDPSDTNKNHCAIYGLDELNPSYIEIVHRAPVNVNSAAREVLIALLADLQGFFVSERRSFAPYSPSPKDAEQGGVATAQRYHSWWTVSQTFDEREEDADQYGFLYRTSAIRAPAGEAGKTQTEVSQDAVSAAEIADHIVACRERLTLGQTNYKTAWFGGPFRTWSQFNRFVDNLVETEVIRDRRSIYYDYVPTDGWESLTPQVSTAGQKFASYAIGDVLKANFNPNLHLNELNPDANVYLRVDKTDLIVNSTEFTFMPTGIFEVESLGRVLRPANSRFTGDKAFYRIEAERRALVTVRAFEPYRETSQRHFHAGRFAPKESRHPTNSGAALEMGPEPQAGPLVYDDHFAGYTTQATYAADGHRGYPIGSLSRPSGWGYEFDGYITLSTNGGGNAQGASGPRMSSACTPHWPVEHGGNKEGLHAHFQSGFDAAHNSGLDRRELAGGTMKSEVTVANYPDAAGEPAGPLGPLTGSDGAHRLARSFRLPPRGSAPVGPHLPAFAPGDLRVDGFYSERNCGAAYVMKQRPSTERPGVTSDQAGNFTFHGGVISLWIKPSFFPEHTGKMRNIVSMSKYHEHKGYRNPAPFNLMFLPAHDMPPYQPSRADELGRWARPGGRYGDASDPPRPKGGPIAPKCEYRDPFSPMYDGNIGIASEKIPTELRGNLALGVWQFRPASFMAFRGATTADAGLATGSGGAGGPLPDLVDIENYAVTSCLNHNLHDHGLDTGSTPNPRVKPADLRPNYFEAHRWTHVLLSWQVLPPW